MKLSLKRTHCTCNNISYREIIHIVDKHEDIKNINTLQQYCCCADRCNKCSTDVQKIIDFFRLKL
jgi:bacterioferritin-associated ferredoxin